VNPRFGEWDPDSGQVRVADPLGDVQEGGRQQPPGTPGEAPGGPPAPEATD
jgi:hypothetical protein